MRIAEKKVKKETSSLFNFEIKIKNTKKSQLIN